MATTSVRATTLVGRRQSALGFAGNALVRVLTYALMLLLAVVFLFPFYMMVVGSFMPLNDLFSFTPNVWPLHPTFDNYTQLFKQFPYYRYLFNSFALAAGQTAGVVFFCSLAGFIFAKRKFPGRDALFVAMLITLMVPGQSTLIPFYLLMAQLGWLNTFLPLWIPFWAPAFGVFLMRQFIASTIPGELLDAGTSDGCSLFGLYWRIVVPIMLPAITILALLNLQWGQRCLFEFVQHIQIH